MKNVLSIFTLLLVFGCLDDDSDCPNGSGMKLEKEELSTMALAYNPYLDTNTKLVFMDQDNNEYEFNIERNFVQTSTNQISNFCYEGDYYKLYLRGIDLSLYFHIWINDVPKPNAQSVSGENLALLVSEEEDSNGVLSLGELSIEHSINIIDESGTPFNTDKTITLDSLILNGKTYFNVIKNNDGELTPKYEVYYNTGLGLVGFTDSVTNKVYNLVRVE